MTRTAARISWLLEPEREIYRVQRGPAVSYYGVPLMPGCIRCGGRCGVATGARAPLVFWHRVRGSVRRDVCTGEIHRGCIPEPGHDVLRIRARSLRASQVRA